MKIIRLHDGVSLGECSLKWTRRCITAIACEIKYTIYELYESKYNLRDDVIPWISRFHFISYNCDILNSSRKTMGLAMAQKNQMRERNEELFLRSALEIYVHFFQSKWKLRIRGDCRETTAFVKVYNICWTHQPKIWGYCCSCRTPNKFILRQFHSICQRILWASIKTLEFHHQWSSTDRFKHTLDTNLSYLWWILIYFEQQV